MRRLAAALLLIAVAIVSGCTSDASWPPEDIGECRLLEEHPGLYDGLEGIYTHDRCYMTLAGSTGNVSICFEIEDPDSSRRCVAEVAGSTGQFSFCFSLDTPYRHNCLYDCFGDCGSGTRLVIDGRERTVSFGRMPGEMAEDECRSELLSEGSPLSEICAEVLSKSDMNPDICNGLCNHSSAVCRYHYALYYADEEACMSLGNRTYEFSNQSRSTQGSIVMGESHYLGSFDKEDCMEVIRHFRKSS